MKNSVSTSTVTRASCPSSGALPIESLGVFAQTGPATGKEGRARAEHTSRTRRQGDVPEAERTPVKQRQCRALGSRADMAAETQTGL